MPAKVLLKLNQSFKFSSAHQSEKKIHLLYFPLKKKQNKTNTKEFYMLRVISFADNAIKHKKLETKDKNNNKKVSKRGREKNNCQLIKSQ